MNPLVHSMLLYRACALLGRITTLPIATADVVCHTRHRARWGKHWRKETRDCSRFHRGGGTDRDLCWQTGALQKMKKNYSVKLCGLERKANRGAKRSTRTAYYYCSRAMRWSGQQVVWISSCLLYHVQAASCRDERGRNQKSAICCTEPHLYAFGESCHDAPCVSALLPWYSSDHIFLDIFIRPPLCC